MNKKGRESALFLCSGGYALSYILPKARFFNANTLNMNKFKNKIVALHKTGTTNLYKTTTKACSYLQYVWLQLTNPYIWSKIYLYINHCGRAVYEEE